ncbi:hypothetical protein G6F65_016044 [Rhizopus arrhizus]|nr:hypothetical protein G6F65_016044 [Rhizopus arrhizus]
MIKVVIGNLRPKCAHRFIFIFQNVHLVEYELVEKLNLWAPGCEIISLDGLTEGAACTVLMAKKFIDNDDPLMIANSDQYIDADINSYLNEIALRKLDGLIMTMKASDPKWSFVGLDADGLVNTVVEKKVISDEATVGIYNFARGRDFVAAAESMIALEERVNGEYYVAPAYNHLTTAGKAVGIFNVGSEAEGMYGLGTPADLELFLTLPVHVQATEGL